MSLQMRSLQVWLNCKGAEPRLVVDGQGGPATRQALLDVFVNRDAPAITTSGLAMIADELGASLRQVAAVAAVESRGGGWDNAGRLKCLWERHYLWRRIRVKVPLLSNPKPGGYTVDADRDGINDSWEKLADATCRWGPDKAFECASFGKFQIMGAHWKAMGYPSAVDFVWQLSRSELAHYRAFARYLQVNHLVDDLRRVDGNPENAKGLTLGYNGSNGVRNGYHIKIAHEYRSFR